MGAGGKDGSDPVKDLVDGYKKKAKKVNTCTGTCFVGWGRDKKSDIVQTTFSNAFSSMKMFVLWLLCSWD